MKKKPQKNIVDSNRIQYTPSEFAKSSLLYIQEIGKLQAKEPHKSKHENLDSYLIILVNRGTGILNYSGQDYDVKKGDIIFINCKHSYYHYTSNDLWNISWIHFNGPTADKIYNKFLERGGKPAFIPNNFDQYTTLWDKLYKTTTSTDYIRDMKINTDLSAILCLLMIDSWNPENNSSSNKTDILETIRKYLDDNYKKKITLDEISESYYINKYYLTRIFKKKYGVSITTYVTNLRITHSKQDLRFSEKTIQQIGIENGFEELYYFSRKFKEIEGISPQQYRKKWK